MIRRPPRSTLFPYTTALPISEAARDRGRPLPDRPLADDSDRGAGKIPDGVREEAELLRPLPLALLDIVSVREQVAAQCERSEEHTSELQSPCNLVCRLLLEKK